MFILSDLKFALGQKSANHVRAVIGLNFDITYSFDLHPVSLLRGRAAICHSLPDLDNPCFNRCRAPLTSVTFL